MRSTTLTFPDVLKKKWEYLDLRCGSKNQIINSTFFFDQAEFVSLAGLTSVEGLKFGTDVHGAQYAMTRTIQDPQDPDTSKN